MIETSAYTENSGILVSGSAIVPEVEIVFMEKLRK